MENSDSSRVCRGSKLPSQAREEPRLGMVACESIRSEILIEKKREPSVPLKFPGEKLVG